jgi:5-methylcytosine-specific restriction protein A
MLAHAGRRSRHLSSRVQQTPGHRQLEELLAEAQGVPNSKEATFESKVSSARRRLRGRAPDGSRSPVARESKALVFERDPEVKAWVLNSAKGACESCKSEAPFTSFENEPFLEVNHVRRLADGGSDTVSNAVALCPNCHRAMHHAIDREARVEKLFADVTRLVRE